MMMMMMMNLGYRVGDDCDEFRRMRNEKLPQKNFKRRIETITNGKTDAWRSRGYLKSDIVSHILTTSAPIASRQLLTKSKIKSKSLDKITILPTKGMNVVFWIRINIKQE